jgi:hypothetical protein
VEIFKSYSIGTNKKGDPVLRHHFPLGIRVQRPIGPDKANLASEFTFLQKANQQIDTEINNGETLPETAQPAKNSINSRLTELLYQLQFN